LKFLFPLQHKKKKTSFTQLTAGSFANGFSGPKGFQDVWHSAEYVATHNFSLG